jgi:phage terminase Nu1 subunit (DNA packaging protein)
MKLVNPSELAELTGKTWRTVTRRLAEAGIEPRKRSKKSDVYASDVALEAIYAAAAGSNEALDLQAERARLAKWQADKTEQEVELRAGRMLDRDQVAAWVADDYATVKARLVQIPDAVAAALPIDVAQRVAADVRTLIFEALAELSAEARLPVDDEAVTDAASDADGEPVG